MRKSLVLLFDSNENIIGQTLSNSFGYFRLRGIQTNENYTVRILAKNRRFNSQNVTVNNEITDLNFIAEP